MVSSGRALAMLAAVATMASVPVIIVSLTPWGGVTGVLLLASLPVLAVAGAGIRAMLETATAAVAVTVVAVLLGGSGPLLPWLGTALVVLLALAASPLVAVGRESTGALMVVMAVYLMAAPGGASAVHGFTRAEATVVLAVLVGLTTAWVAGVLGLALSRVTLPRSEVPTPTLPYTVLLAVLAGLFTVTTLLWFPGTNAWWSVLTVAVVLQPTGARMRAKLLARAGGTALGGLLALGAALWLPPLGLTLVGAAAALGTVIAKVAAAPYWLYAAGLTIALVLLTFTPQDAVTGDILRVGITLGAALVAAIAAVVAATLTRQK